MLNLTLRAASKETSLAPLAVARLEAGDRELTAKMERWISNVEGAYCGARHAVVEYLFGVVSSAGLSKPCGPPKGRGVARSLLGQLGGHALHVVAPPEEGVNKGP